MVDLAEKQPSVAAPAALDAAVMLGWRELVRFFRQRHRVFGAVAQPIIFWLLFGAGLQRTFRLGSGTAENTTFLQYFLPGTLMLIVLFTAIFATISVIEDRREGFLQGVLVAPIPRWSMVLGKLVGGTLIALLHALIFLLLAWLLPVSLHLREIVLVFPFLSLCALMLTALGFILAWQMESSQAFHAVMSVILLPMWLLSGAFFPIPLLQPGESVSQVVLHWLMRANPLTYGVAGTRQLLYGAASLSSVWNPSLTSCWLVTVFFTGILFLAAGKVAARRSGALIE